MKNRLMNDKKGQFNLTIFLVLLIVALVCLAAFFFWPKARWIIIGVGMIAGGIWLGGKAMASGKEIGKGQIIIIAILLVLGVTAILASSVLNTALSQTSLGGASITGWQQSVIPCANTADCSSYLLQQGVSQADLNTAEFKCENKLCYFKSK